MKYKTYIKSLILIFLLQSTAFAQNLDEPNLRDHETTLLPENARFAFVQSHIAVKETYRLDRFTGDVWQLVKKDNGDLTWDKLLKKSHPEDKGQKQGEANYQLFLSGFQVKHTILMNIRTGATWEIFQDPETKLLYWSPIK